MPVVSIIEESGDEKKFELKEGDILFDGLDDQGYSLPHGCLSGSCSACKVEVIEGIDNIAAPSFIEKNTIKSVMQKTPSAEGLNLRLSCRARVEGDIKIKHFKGE